MNKLKRCGTCGPSEIKKVAGSGLALPWRDYPSVRLIESFECLRCQQCSELFLNASQLRQLDILVQESITANVKYFIQKIIDREKCEQREIAIHIGLSPEYLSEIKSGRKIPSFQTFNFLKILALDEKSFTVSSPDYSDWKIA